MRYNFTLFVLAALLTGTLHADVKPNPLFSDGAVLQRGQKNPRLGKRPRWREDRRGNPSNTLRFLILLSFTCWVKRAAGFLGLGVPRKGLRAG